MATKIDKGMVVGGRMIRVKNTNKKKFSNAKDEYLAVWMEDSTGHNEECLLFTEKEIAAARKRALRNPEDCTKMNVIADLLT